MSGTSVDAIDAVLLSCAHEVRILAAREHPIPAETRQRIAEISQPGDNEIERMGELDRELGALFATATLQLLRQSGHDVDDVEAIGSHGQTIRHHPRDANAGTHGFTLQVGDPNTIAELTGITTVADFRRRDIAAGGEGAPLAPAFHAAVFGQEDTNTAIVNIGGIANVTLLRGRELEAGFDCGPGNTLLDHWVQEHQGTSMDRDGLWARAGTVIPELLARALETPYFARTGPRSTGKELFNPAWLQRLLTASDIARPQDVQATLAELTANTIANSICNSGADVNAVYVCGGGAHNTDLMQRLRRALPGIAVRTTAAKGMDPDHVEAAAFAWFADQTLSKMAGNAPRVTGAEGFRVLGGIYWGSTTGATEHQK
tara:strand:+ start:3314 stop:4432 length:1119 start_codon:yes stop_codon:yes gene_type:complete